MAKANILDKIDARRWCGIEPSLEGGRFHMKATCAKCGVSETWTTRTVFDPVATKARNAKQFAKDKADSEARRAKWDEQAGVNKLRDAAVAALKEIAKGHNDPRTFALEVLAKHGESL